MRTGSKIVGLVAMAAIAAALFAVPAIATAEETSLCREDTAESSCPEEQAATHVHLVSVGKAKLVTSIQTVECDALFLGDASSLSGAPLVIHGNSTYTNCNGACAATEENGPTEFKVLKEGHETAKVTGEGLVHVVCGSSIDCSYNGTGLTATAKGPLLASHENGEVSLTEQTATKEAGGFLCPKTSKLSFVLEPLEKLYIRKEIIKPPSTKPLSVQPTKKRQPVLKNTN